MLRSDESYVKKEREAIGRGAVEFRAEWPVRGLPKKVAFESGEGASPTVVWGGRSTDRSCREEPGRRLWRERGGGCRRSRRPGGRSCRTASSMRRPPASVGLEPPGRRGAEVRHQPLSATWPRSSHGLDRGGPGADVEASKGATRQSRQRGRHLGGRRRGGGRTVWGLRGNCVPSWTEGSRCAGSWVRLLERMVALVAVSRGNTRT